MSPVPLSPLERYQTLFADLDRAARDCGRVPDDVTLIAVSKTFDSEAIRPFLKLGHRHFGENRVQEAMQKWPALREEFPDPRLHLIGPLQSNKAREAVALFDVIHTVDRLKIAQALAQEQARQGKKLTLFVQVNTGEEAQKAGVAPLDLEAFLHFVREECGLFVEGLMCIPPVDQPPSPHFALLRRMAAEHGLPLLSMGMSADYRQAIMLGATHVRVGSALFGYRSV